MSIECTTNEQLQELVESSHLPPAVALTIFNRGLGPAACSESQWKGFMAQPGSERHRALPPELLAHAIAQFAQIGVHHEASPA